MRLGTCVLVGVFCLGLALGGGVVLSFLSRTRTAVFETETRNNLRQASLAIQSFHDTYRKLPPGFDVGAMYPTKPKSMWFQIAPYVEADCIYRNHPDDDVIAAYNSPSDASVTDRRGALSLAVNLRVIAYRTIGHSAATAAGKPFDPPHGTMTCGLTMKHLTEMRGTENIVLLSTRVGVCQGTRTLYAADAHGDNLAGDLRGVGGFMGAGAHSRPATASADIDAIFQAHPADADCLAAPGVFGHSFAPSGLNVAMCDGSVRVFESSTSPAIFAQALCPARLDAPGPPE